jgi:phosphoglycerate dehydrogenase-like enzyme
LPKEAKIIGTGTNLEEFEKNNVPLHEGTILLNVSGTSATLGPIIRNMPELRWVHSSSAGVEHLLCSEIVDNPNITLTNAKGVFSR